MKRIHVIVILITVIIIEISSALYFNHNLQVNSQDGSQQGIVDTIKLNLEQQGIQVKSAQISRDDDWNPPILVEYVIQSSSSGNKYTPVDTINWNLVGRAVTLAQYEGLIVGVVGFTLVNTQNVVIFGDLNQVTPVKEISSYFDPPYKLDDSTATSLLANKIEPYGLSLGNYDVSSMQDGFRNIVFSLKASEITVANNGIGEFIDNTRSKINQMNTESGTQIAVYQINLTDAAGKVLLKYINDIQLGRITWWQDDSITYTDGHAPLAIEN